MIQYKQFRYDGPVKIEHRQPWMDAITENKYLVWDDIVRRKILHNGTDLEKAQALQLLRDPTLYAYAFFRDENGQPFKLYSYQDMAINDPNKRVVMVCANQVGKSVSLRIKALTYALNNPGKTVVMSSKTLPQAKDLLRGIRLILNRSVVEYKTMIADTDNTTSIEFSHHDVLPNGAQVERDPSRIICVPATEAALGYPADLYLIDEEDSYENGHDFYFKIAQPRTYTTKGQIMTFSNPWNGEQGILHEHWVSPHFSKYRMDFLDRPGATKEDYDRITSEMSQAEIDCTMRATFTSMIGAFLTQDERKAIQEDRSNALPLVPTSPFFVAFDFAKVEDQTIRAVATAIPGGGIYVHELKAYAQGTPYSIIVDDLQALIKQYGPQQFQAVGWDNTGVGAGIEDFINKIQLLGIMCLPVKFSLENKSRMYTVFKTLAERTRAAREINLPRLLSIPYIKECDKQLSSLRFERSGLHLKVHHEHEREHDDYPDVIACLCGVMVHKDYVASDAVIITQSSARKELYDRRCEECKNPLDDGQEVCPVCNHLSTSVESGFI